MLSAHLMSSEHGVRGVVYLSALEVLPIPLAGARVGG
jgi:hypothetical protein